MRKTLYDDEEGGIWNGHLMKNEERKTTQWKEGVDLTVSK